MSWVELRSFVNHLGRASAFYRARHPKSWWYTPEVAVMEKIAYLLACANWQRSGGKGERPKPPTPPVDRDPTITSKDEVAARKRRQGEHMRKRRAEIAAAENRKGG